MDPLADGNFRFGRLGPFFRRTPLRYARRLDLLRALQNPDCRAGFQPSQLHRALHQQGFAVESRTSGACATRVWQLERRRWELCGAVGAVGGRILRVGSELGQPAI
jgi:hypothetical protein